MLANDGEKPPSNGRSSEPHPLLTPLETEVIALFVQLSRVLGQPRTMAEIYALLFISPRPLPMDELFLRLQMSKASASQGLKFLRNIGAVRPVYIAGDRRVHYEAVAELRNLTTRFLREQVVPHLESGQERLERVAGMVKELPESDRAHVAGRVTMLRSWEKNGRRFLPMLVKIMGG